MTKYDFIGGWGASLRTVPELDRWDTYANHRGIVTGLISKHAPPHAESLCVLGAGHCLDLELRKLVREFPKVTLLDLNQDDVVAGIRLQQQRCNLPAERADDIKLIGDCDLTGIHRMLHKAQQQDKPISAEYVDSILEVAAKYVPPGLGKYDCVASTCVLSQLLFHVNESLGEEHARFVDLLKTVRRRHVEIIVEALRPSGTGLLITDFVSSESLPDLYTTTDLKTTLQGAIKTQNYLHGLNPAIVGQLFHEEGLKTKIKSIQITDPWRWVLPERIYACFAIGFKKL